MKKILILIFILTTTFLFSDSLVMKFYDHVNIYRESLGLNLLERDTRVEHVATTYSEIIAEEGKINHYALTDFEFIKLCNNYNLYTGVLGEILASFPSDFNSYQIFLLYRNSPKHNRELINPDATLIGAGHDTIDGKTFFTAYIVTEEK